MSSISKRVAVKGICAVLTYHFVFTDAVLFRNGFE